MNNPCHSGESAIKLEGDFCWEHQGDPSISNAELDVPVGSLVAVVGSTGSGKTSLLSAMLGLMEHVSGPEVELSGKVCLPAPRTLSPSLHLH